MSAFNPKDYYFKKAKKENYAARSVFKLQEIDDKYRLFKPGNVVLDMGCAPGSWSQYASEKVGHSGRVLGIDLQEVRLSLPNVEFLRANLLETDPLLEIKKIFGVETKFDLVLSDMAPKTTGIRITDQARSYELCELALNTAIKTLKDGGHFVCKLFHSDDFTQLRDTLKKNFKKVEVLKPKSTRQQSKEIFLIGIQFNGSLTTGARG